jgi:ABC-type transport system substrate-binding protein
MARAYDDLQLEFTTAAQGAGGLNWVYYSNPEFDQSLEQAVHEPDADKRSALYRKANEILVEDAPALWIMSRNYNAPIRDKVEGYTYSAMYLDTFDFHALRCACEFRCGPS